MRRRSAMKDQERDREEAEAAAMAASRHLEKLARRAEEEEEMARRYEEVERKTKRYFDKNGDNTGAVYYGEYVESGDDWLPHGYGEFRLASGETIYQGPFVNGKRSGKEGTVTFQNGDQWKGPFANDEPRGLGTLTKESSSPKAREAFFHSFGKRAWLDELVPGRRLRVLGKDATIVAADSRRPSVYRVHFDDQTARVVDLAQEPFVLLFHQSHFHKIAVDESSHRSRSIASPVARVANIFRPEDEIDEEINKVDEKMKMETMRRVWETRLERQKTAQQRLSARSELDSAIEDQRQRAAAEAVQNAASQSALAEEMARRRATRLSLIRRQR